MTNTTNNTAKTTEVTTKSAEPKVLQPTTTAAPAQATAPKVEKVEWSYEGKKPEEIIAHHGGNKSAAMRAMLGLGMKCGPISKALNVRFQFVNNVQREMLRQKG